MPYVNGKRVSNEEWVRLYGTQYTKLHTGANGENPADAPAVDPATGVPPVEKQVAGGNRSAKSAAATKAAIADALGVKSDSPSLDDIDVEGLDSDIKETE